MSKFKKGDVVRGAINPDCKGIMLSEDTLLVNGHEVEVMESMWELDAPTIDTVPAPAAEAPSVFGSNSVTTGTLRIGPAPLSNASFNGIEFPPHREPYEIPARCIKPEPDPAASYAAFRQTVRDIVEPRLPPGVRVLCDRTKGGALFTCWALAGSVELATVSYSAPAFDPGRSRPSFDGFVCAIDRAWIQRAREERRTR